MLVVACFEVELQNWTPGLLCLEGVVVVVVVVVVFLSCDIFVCLSQNEHSSYRPFSAAHDVGLLFVWGGLGVPQTPSHTPTVCCVCVHSERERVREPCRIYLPQQEFDGEREFRIGEVPSLLVVYPSWLFPCPRSFVGSREFERENEP
jgi:hypothetical protein